MKLPLIGLIAVYSFSIPAIAGVARYKRMDTAMRVFAVFCIFSFLLEIFEYVLSLKHVNNTSVSNYYVVFEWIFICLVYLLSLRNEKVKRIVSMVAVLFLCIWILDRIYFDVPGAINSEMAMTSRIFIILVSVLTIHSTVAQTERAFISEPMFWVSSGFLIYSTGVAVIVGLTNTLMKMGTSYYIAAWYINWSLEILSNVILTKGFFCTTKYQL